MKSLCLAATLIVALIAPPVLAQLGPAGVPGAPGLAETDPSVKVAKPLPQERPAVDSAARGEKKTAQPKLAKAGKVCRPGGKAGVASCKPRPAAKATPDCRQSSDPARCERYQRAREVCRNKLGSEHRQCLRNILAPDT